MSYSLVIPPDLVSSMYFIRQKISVPIRKQIIVSIKKHIKEHEEVLSMKSRKIDEDMLEKIKALGLPEKQENNEYILLHVYGDKVRAPETFNAKVYSGKKGLKLVTNDYETLVDLINKKEKNNIFSRTIFIDDSGVGFPLQGILVGAYDTKTNRTEIEEVSVEFFQSPKFENQEYLDEAANVALKLLEKFNVNPKDTLIKICTGFVNIKIKMKLREIGYAVEIAKIGEPLQSELEKKHKEYIKRTTGYSNYYDPKETSNISSEFNNVINWINKKPEERLKFAKTGWEYFKNRVNKNENTI